MNDIQSSKAVKDLQEHGSTILAVRSPDIDLVFLDNMTVQSFINTIQGSLEEIAKDLLWDVICGCDFPVIIGKREYTKGREGYIGYITLTIRIDKQ
jgi:hypothetical protein